MSQHKQPSRETGRRSRIGSRTLLISSLVVAGVALAILGGAYLLQSGASDTTTTVASGASAIVSDAPVAGSDTLTAESEPSASLDGTRVRALELMELHRSIQLTPEQEALKHAALSEIAAPCCAKFTAATCCCECNLARTIWGLSKELIAHQGYGKTQVIDAVETWLATVNPDGFGGAACFTGGCNRPFGRDGCGGMLEDRLLT